MQVLVCRTFPSDPNTQRLIIVVFMTNKQQKFRTTEERCFQGISVICRLAHGFLQMDAKPTQLGEC